MLHHKELRNDALTMMAVMLCFLLLGAVMFTYIEGWNFIDSFYFVTMTSTTVGYGDFVPTHNASKIITMLYALSIIPIVLYTFSLIARYNLEMMKHRMSGIEKEQQTLEEEIAEDRKRLAAQKKKLKAQEEENIKQEAQILAQKELLRKEMEAIQNKSNV
jgi:hypothetical protein